MVCFRAWIVELSHLGVSDVVGSQMETRTGGGDVRCGDGGKCDLCGENDSWTSNEIFPDRAGLYGKIHACGARDEARTDRHDLYRGLCLSGDVSGLGLGLGRDLSMSSGFDAFCGLNDVGAHDPQLGVSLNPERPGGHAVESYVT